MTASRDRRAGREAAPIAESTPRVRRVPLALWLVVVWLALWQDASVATAIAGGGVALVLLWVFPPRAEASPTVVRPGATLHLAVHFAAKLVEATFVVAWEVVTPRNRIHEAIVGVPLEDASDTVTALVANAVSLIPGTLTLEVTRDPTVLYVHVLHLRDVERARDEVQRLEELAIRAFGHRPSGSTSPEGRAR